MTIVLVVAACAIAVIIAVVMLSQRNTDRPQRHRHRATRSRAERDHDTETLEILQNMPRERSIAREPVPEVTHEEFLPAPLAEAPAYPPDDFLTVPVRPAPESPRRVRAQVLSRLPLPRKDRPILPPMVAGPAIAIAASLAAMAQRVAATDRREIMRLLAVNQQLRREVEHLQPAGDELQKLRAENGELRDRLDFAHLFDTGVQYSDWRWDTDSGIMRRITKADLAAMDEELAA